MQVDIRPEALSNRCPLALGLLGDVRQTLLASSLILWRRTNSRHLDDALDHYKKARQALDAHAESGPNSKVIHPQYVTRLVERTCSRRHDLHL